MSAQKTFLFAAILMVHIFAPLPGFSQPSDLTYVAVPQCRFLDTRLAGGPFAAGEARTYNVVGSGSFASQGGSATGCGLPGFSNGVARVQAVMINVAAISAAGPGNLSVSAADQTTSVSMLNYSAVQNIANTGPIDVAQVSGIGDIKIQANFSSTHVVASVVGYFTRFGETILVSPGSSPAASGTNLLNAVASITDNSASKPYLIKIEPGVYDLGLGMLTMKPYVDVEGSGEGVTRIVSRRGSAPFEATVLGADNAELRDVKVENLGGEEYAIAILNPGTSLRITRVTAIGSGAAVNYGIRNRSCSLPGPVLTDVTATAIGGTIAYGVVFSGCPKGVLRRAVVSASNSQDNYGVFVDTDGQFPPPYTTLDNLESSASGGTRAYGVYIAGGDFELRSSKIAAGGGSISNAGLYHSQSSPYIQSILADSTIAATGPASYGVQSSSNVRAHQSRVSGGTNSFVGSGLEAVGGSYLEGGPAVGVTCAGVYDESFTFFVGPGCP